MCTCCLSNVLSHSYVWVLCFMNQTCNRVWKCTAVKRFGKMKKETTYLGLVIFWWWISVILPKIVIQAFAVFIKYCHNCLKYEIVLKTFLLSHLEYWQIWLYVLMDDRHMSKITKLKKKSLLWCSGIFLSYLWCSWARHHPWHSLAKFGY